MSTGRLVEAGRKIRPNKKGVAELGNALSFQSVFRLL